MGVAEQDELDRLRRDIKVLRTMIDRELDEGRSGGIVLRATSRVLDRRLEEQRELEQRQAFQVRTRRVRPTE